MIKNIKTIFYAILISFCIILIFNYIVSKQKGEKLFFINGYSSAVILSGSMEPTLSIDDLVIIKTKKKYEPGDIVVFESDNKLIVHRIVKINDEYAVTRGDANNVDDDKIEVSKIKGYVVSHFSGVGKLIRFIKSPYGTRIIVFLLFIAFAINKLHQKIKDSEKINYNL